MTRLAIMLEEYEKTIEAAEKENEMNDYPSQKWPDTYEVYNPKKSPALSRQAGGQHYKDFAIQPYEFCHKNKLGHLESNVVKYVCRYKFKGGAEDLRKAIHTLECLLEMEY